MNKMFLEIPQTPCYIIDEGRLKTNLEILSGLQRQTKCKIILALKGFSMFSMFPLIREYLTGASASSLHEARLAFSEFGGDVHVCSPAYEDENFTELIKYANYITFNSFSQWRKFKSTVFKIKKNIKCGLRINPEHPEVKTALYDPCAPKSRLGIRRDEFIGENLEGITGLHFHTLCELNSDSLQRTLEKVEQKFGEILKQMNWINFGGGHHITRDDYDITLLCRLINDFRKKYDIEIYLEPGEAVVLNTGFLVASVLDIVHNTIDIAILDASAAAHMPDVLEMPYKPRVYGAGEPGKNKYTYRLAGNTCLAGDIIGDYSFKKPLSVGDRLVFEDMAHYTMVKNNTFNGVRLPSIASYNSISGKVRVIREFGYEDYRNRLS